jgi:hypothetical protein
MRLAKTKPKGGNKMNQKMEFPEGIFAKAPADNAPDFVKGKLTMKLDEAVGWLKSKQDSGETWVTLDIKEGQSGKWYASVNDWKPKQPSGQQGGRMQPVPDDDMPW